MFRLPRPKTCAPVAQATRCGLSSRIDAVGAHARQALSIHSHPSISYSQYSTTAARVNASASKSDTFASAHSWSDVFVSMTSCSQPLNWGFKGGSL